MAWLGKVSLGGFPDIAGAVTKLSESVKNIEKNFDTALGLEEKSDTGEGDPSVFFYDLNLYLMSGLKYLLVDHTLAKR